MKQRNVKRILKKLIFLAVIFFAFSILAIKLLNRQRNEISVLSATFSVNKNVAAVSEDELEDFTQFYDVNVPMPLAEPIGIIEEDELDLSQFYNINVPFRLPAPKGPKRDWSDYVGIELEMQRSGLGEQGKAAYIMDESKRDLEAGLSLQNGFNALLSDQVSVNRSVPDVRIAECRHRQYLANMPTTSVVIPFYNEHFTVLIRSLHSIKNRTPAELLHEIIIVDDFSDRKYLKQQLDDYVNKNFKSLVKIIRLSERAGLIGARLEGARRATGDVLVFLDSHIECNYNWLPPLLEPIAVNKRISTCPVIDGIDHATFEYNGDKQMGTRGAFDWQFVYKQLPVLPADSEDSSQPFRNPIMMGGLFAISREFFWEIGAYDEGLDIWGAEQYELSFKIWMCGGLLLDIPCSRIAHIFRGPTNVERSSKIYLPKNYKRVAEVWMDEYKNYIYENLPETRDIDAGDLDKQIEIRKKLKCKSFKWFLDEIAPDIVKAYPPILPPIYASGVIQSYAYPPFCLDTLGKDVYEVVGLYTCALNKTHPQPNQFWTLSNFRDIRLFKGDTCLDVHDTKSNASIWLWSCHNEGANQFWSYDIERQMIVHGVERNSCMEALLEDNKIDVFVNPCDELNPRMKWSFGWTNETAMSEFWTNLTI